MYEHKLWIAFNNAKKYERKWKINLSKSINSKFIKKATLELTLWGGFFCATFVQHCQNFYVLLKHQIA